MLFVAVGFILIVFIFYFYRFSDWDFTTNASKPEWGAFGDFIGGTLNPLLSFLGLIALLFTIALQNKELSLSKRELELTRQELERSASAQEQTKTVLDEQYKTQIKQQFENTFFALLGQHNKALENLVKNQAYTNMKSLLKAGNYSQSVGRNLYEANIFVMKNNHLLGSYFRILYQLLKFIIINIPSSNVKCFNDFKKGNLSDLAYNEKMYSNMVRAFLNNDITLLLAVNCYCNKAESDDYWGYKLLVERYAFFEHLASSDEYYNMVENGMGLRDDIKKYYEKSAFGNNKFFLN